MNDAANEWSIRLVHGASLAEPDGIVFGSAAIALHGIRQKMVQLVRPPKDIDVFGRAFPIAERLLKAGYVRTGAREFRLFGDEHPVQLWDSNRAVHPEGVPPCLGEPDVLRLSGKTIQVATLADLLTMKQLMKRHSAEKTSRDHIDIDVIKELFRKISS